MRHTLVAPTFEGRDRGNRFVSAPLDVGQFPGLVEEQLLGTVEPTQGLERAVRPSSSRRRIFGDADIGGLRDYPSGRA
jgi:hypothetical protein